MTALGPIVMTTVLLGALVVYARYERREARRREIVALWAPFVAEVNRTMVVIGQVLIPVFQEVVVAVAAVVEAFRDAGLIEPAETEETR